MPTNYYREPISNGLRFRILHRDHFTCQYCGANGPGVPLVIDHVVPVSQGGKTKPNNLVTACHQCNCGKHARFLVNFPNGGSWEDPLDFPPLIYRKPREFVRSRMRPILELTPTQVGVCELVADAECRAFYKLSRRLDIDEILTDPTGDLPEERDEYKRVILEDRTYPDENWGFPGEDGWLHGLY